MSRFAEPAGFDSAEAARAAAAAGSDFETYFWNHTGRLAHKWPHYFPIYEKLLAPYRAGFPLPEGGRRPLRFLEIGVSDGGSQQLWRRYLGGDAILFGIDIDPRCGAIDDADLNIRIGSQDDPKFLASVVDEMGGVDVVLDDGSHIGRHQRASLEILWPRLCLGGLYLIEDTHTAYWRSHEGAHGRSGTIIEVAKSMVDDMHERYHGLGQIGTVPGDEIGSIGFYDSVIAIEKVARRPSMHVKRGTQTV